LAVVVGGTSAEFTLKAVKLASTHYLDDLPTTGNISASANTPWNLLEPLATFVAINKED